MFKIDQTNERQLFAFTPRELLPEDSDVWLYIDLFASLDLEDFYTDYSSQGGEAIDPRLMLRTIFFGLTHGCFSGRKLALSCKVDLRYLVLSGHLCPSYRVFHRFLLRHEKQLTELFVQIVRLAQKMGLVKLGRLAIDGTRVKAYTSQCRTMKYEKMDAAIAKIKADIATMKSAYAEEAHENESDGDEELEKSIKDREARLASIEKAKAAIEKEAREKDQPVKVKTQKSFSDLDAVPMGATNCGFIIGYNAQAVVDDASQIVVAADVFQAASDRALLTDMLEKTANNCGKVGKEILADTGYFSVINQEAIESRGAQAFIAPQRERNMKDEKAQPLSTYEQLTPGENEGEYACLAGKILPVVTRDKEGRSHVKFGAEFCDGCPSQKDCGFYGRRGKQIRLIEEDKRQTLAKMYRNARSAEHQGVYKFRKAIVEPVFGNIKYNKCLRLYVRSKAKVTLWWQMVCMAHNIEKMIGQMG